MAGKKEVTTNTGQAMVEFALIILVLLFLIFVIIEGARIFQANLTVQNAARSAGRYAITGQFDPQCLSESPPCTDPRVDSIKAMALEALGGLALDPTAVYEEPQYYLVEVIGTDENGNQIPGYAGAPGMPVMVRVTYRVGMITPLVRPIANTVRVIGQVVMNNEQFSQISTSSSRNQAPPIAPYPTAGPSPTPPPPDLGLTKNHSNNPAIVDEEFQYIIGVVNSSPTSATSIVLTDTLPSGVDYVGGTAGCTPAGGDVVCTFDLAGNASTNFVLRVIPRQEAVDNSPVTNTATVSHPGDVNTANNSDDVTTQIVGTPTDADLVISKSASSTLVAVGDEFVYTLGVLNNGLATATSVTVTDTLPAQVTLVSATASRGSCGASGNVVTCQLGDLARDASANVNIRVRADQEATVTNTATVSANEVDPDMTNNESSDDVEIRNVSDLSISKAASADPGVNEVMTYTLTAANNGPAAATNVQVEDSLPVSVDFVSASASQGTCSESGNVVRCNLGNLADAGSATITIVVVPSQARQIVNEVSISGDRVDPYTPNNEYTLLTTVQTRADVEIDKAGPESTEAGQVMSYTLTVTNNGPSTAESVVVNDTLPADVSFVSASASQGTCSGSNSAVTCNLENMASGASATITIRIIPNVASSIENTASVASNTTDPDSSNNSDSATTSVTGTAPYIILNSICGRPGDEVVVRGFGWQTDQDHQYDLYLEWLPSGGSAELLTITSDPINNPFDNTINWTRTVRIPENAVDGIHQIQARRWRSQGGGDTQAEDTANFEIPCPAPNLVSGQPELVSPAQPVVGDALVFRAEVSNIGNLDAVSQFFTGLYFDPAPAPTADSTHISQAYREAIVGVNGLAAGASKTITFTVNAGFSSDGAHQVYAVADSDPGPDGVITTEHDETDNISAALPVSVDPVPTATPGPSPTATGTATVTPGPSPTATATATPGPSPTATATATPGPSPTPTATPLPGNLLVTVFNEEGEPQANAEIRVYEQDTDLLVATGYSATNGTHNFEELAPGTYRVTACIRIETTDYESGARDVLISSDSTTQQVLFLELAPAGCT